MLTPLAAVIVYYLVLAVAISTKKPGVKREVIRSRDGPGGYINLTSASNEPVALSVSTLGGVRNATAPLLYGWQFEDINHSGDGGIYAEMIVNRAFQGSSYLIGAYPGVPGGSIVSSENPIIPTAPVLNGYRSIGGARLTLDLFHSLSPTLPTVMEVDIPSNATGEVGFINEGFWGFDVSPQTYNVSMYLLANGPRGNYQKLTGLTVSLRSNTTSEVFASTKISLTHPSFFDYTALTAQLVNTAQAPDTNNTFAVTFDASEVAGATFYFGLISLFPETFKDRPNGLRKDLALAVNDLNPKFLRFPGGNNIEGFSITERWIWNETIGPLINRKGRAGNWDYFNTNGLGLLEYLQWCEDIGMEPLLAIYSGFSLDIFGYGGNGVSNGGTSYPEDRMGEVLQSALDELEFCMGDVSTQYGSLRAQYGHAEPFNINYVELGNEDWFSGTYPYRFPILYDGIKAAYPNMTLISTAYNEATGQGFNYTIDLPKDSMWDTHHYEEPSFFFKSFNFWDNWQQETGNEDVTVLVGEYSVYQIDTPDGVVNYSNPADEHITYPRLISAIAESVYLLGAERNPNTVKMTCYAPSFENYNGDNWTPDLVLFNTDPAQTSRSVSWYSQSLFAHYRGTETLPISNSQGDFDPLWWGAAIDTPLNIAYVKVINSGNETVPLSISFDVRYSDVNGTIITSPDPNGSNFFGNQTAIVPLPIPIPASASNNSSNSSIFQWDVPKYSISVLQFNL